MDITIAREVAARIWGDQEMSSVVMDVGLAEEIAQLLARRLTKREAASERLTQTVGRTLCPARR